MYVLRNLTYKRIQYITTLTTFDARRRKLSQRRLPPVPNPNRYKNLGDGELTVEKSSALLGGGTLRHLDRAARVQEEEPPASEAAAGGGGKNRQIGDGLIFSAAARLADPPDDNLSSWSAAHTLWLTSS
jgi:hypothetical protein